MKRAALLFLVLMMVATPVFASDGPTGAIYRPVKQSIYPELIGEFNYLSTLRMTFPDICFKINNEMLGAILQGEQYDFVDIEKIHYLYGTGLYLFLYQIRVLSHQYRILSLPNVECEMLVETQNLTPAQEHLFQYYVTYFREQGFLNLLK